MKQLTIPALNDATRPLAHATDPVPSHEAAERHVRTEAAKEAAGVPTNKERVLRALRGMKHRAATADELARDGGSGLSVYEIRRRLCDLERDGKVYKEGTRPCRVKGHNATSWRAM